MRKQTFSAALIVDNCFDVIASKFMRPSSVKKFFSFPGASSVQVENAPDIADLAYSHEVSESPRSIRTHSMII